MTLIEALQALDIANDEHWTKEGLPLLAVLHEMTGADVSRADITAVAPAFNRANPVVGTATPNPWALGETDAGDGDLAPTPNEVPSTDGMTALQVAEVELHAAQDAFSMAKVVLAKAQTRYDKALAESEAANAMDHADVMALYLRAQASEVEQAVARQVRIAEAVAKKLKA